MHTPKEQDRCVEFIGTCPHLLADDLHAYDDTARDIGFETFRRHVGPDVIQQIHEDLGYAGSSLTLKGDYHVRYSRGKWQGQPAVCMMHSAIHHIWVLRHRNQGH